MANIGPTAIVQALLMLLLTAILDGLVLSWCWLIWRLVTGRPILPERPLVDRREPQWGAGSILLVLLTYLAVSLFISKGYRLAAMLSAMKPPADSAEPESLPFSHMMLLNGVIEIVLLIAVPYVVRRASGARLRDLGLCFDGWWRQAAVGVVATLIAAPPVYAVQFMAMKIWAPQPHPVEEMIAKEFSVGVGGLAIVTAVVLAPMFEELVFRGLLQSWLLAVLNRCWRPPAVTAPEQIGSLATTDKPRGTEGSDEAKPELLVISDMPKSHVPAIIESWGRPGLAILMTSLLFAYVHAPQWPAPIALFLLAIVIGTVYERTGSLIAAVFMHATFNGISTAVLFLTALTSEKLGPK